jgi:hypothetical protein
MWTVPIEVAFVLARNGSGVLFVVDQDPAVHSARTLRT